MQNLVQPPKQKNGKKEKPFPTELTLSLRYLPYCEGITAAKLVIGVEVGYYKVYKFACKLKTEALLHSSLVDTFRHYPVFRQSNIIVL